MWQSTCVLRTLLPARDDAPVQRLVRLAIGLALYGISITLMVRADLGLDPWDVLHQGLSRTFGLSIGTWVIIASVLVLLAWWPLRQRPGFGTVSNVLAVGLVVNATIDLFDTPASMPVRVVLVVAAIVLNGLATGLYIGAGLGPGARDGLTTGLVARGHSIRVVRTTIELSVLAAGFLLGGSVGIGTLAYAFAIGPIMHLTVPALALRRARTPEPEPAA